MRELYYKNSDGNYNKITIDEIVTEDLENKLVIIKIGNDRDGVTSEDAEKIANAFASAKVLSSIKNSSIILTPNEISIEVLDKEDIKDKKICVSINKSTNLSGLEAKIKNAFDSLKERFDSVVLPTPISVEEYLETKDVLKRCEKKKVRRSQIIKR